jgi:hypothetical protein
MIKILMGLASAVVIAVAGFFGFQFYTQHRIAGEIDAAFEQIRAAGGKASHGAVSFDLWRQTVEIADIAAETATQPPVSVKIASLKAAGVRQPDATRFSADTIQANDIDVGAGMPGPAAWRFTYKVPQLSVKDYSGPVSLSLRPDSSSSAIAIYRFAIEQFTAVDASSVTVPSLVMTIDAGPVMSAGYTYSGLALQNIRGGKVATMKVDRVAISADMQQAGMQQTGKPEKMTGELVNLAAYDFDATAAATILDPQKATDDQYYRVYRKMTAGAYTLSFDKGLHMRIDGMTIDDVGVRPSRLQLGPLMELLPTAGNAAALPPAQARALIEKVASLYEGLGVGNAEMNGFAMDTPQGPIKFSAIRFNLKNGKIGEFAIEGLDTRSAQGPVKVGRFALKSIDIANLLRMTAQFSNPAQKPSPDQLAGLLALLEGVEVKGFVAPYKDSGKPVTIDTFDLHWGQFVGPIPSRLRLTAKMSAPVDARDPKLQPLVAAGLNTLAADCDVGAEWTETSHTFVLDAPALDIDGIMKASARIALGNVPRQIFSLDPQQAAAMAAQLEAGTIELTVRDTGGVDFAVAEYARIQNVSRDAARQAIVDNIRASSETIVAANPDGGAFVDAMVHFIETPHTALTLKLTPLGKVPVMQLLQALQTDPAIALAQFRAEASTGL